ncbi:ABC transporter permease [Rhizobium rhizogenes]|uniref:ABC transporter permease n=1 Tax=Rhizobium rhizogenes TaxID=359 RepID=UPI001571CE36|nr:ABC transporter permease [Rhizobium rhizogenes]NTI78704.1 ABC transporter permease [Rhizobium rhizogenes]
MADVTFKTSASADPPFGRAVDRGLRGIFPAIPGITGWMAKLALGVAVPLAVIALWSYAVHQEWLAEQILPDPRLVYDTTLDLILTGQLPGELAVSLGRVAAGVAIGGGLGLFFGLAFGLVRPLDLYVAPTVRAICLVPSLGWLPFFMLLFGIGEALKIILIAKTCYLPLMVSAYEGIRSRPRKYDDVARALELPWLAKVRFVVWPSVLPFVLNGLRQALSRGWKALILVEMISSAAGLGYLMMWGRKALQLDVVFATLIVIGLVGWALDYALTRFQHRITGWSFKAAV